MKILLTGIFLIYAAVAYTQTDKKRIFRKKLLQFSIAPGVGTNGLNPGGFINYFSLNLTSGYSAANELIELAGISNFHTAYSHGIQLAGLVNLTGGNAFAAMTEKEKNQKIKSGYEANLAGIQLSGLANIVLTNTFGLQASGGINLTKNALFGAQIAGISNTVIKYSFGLQIAGLYNSSAQAMDGIQISSLFNVTNGQLQGTQVSLFNRSRRIEGKNTYSYSGSTGLQLGLFNSAEKMNGFQIGLINFGGQMQGTQIGVINFYRTGELQDTRDGTSIGLLNIGQTYNIQVYTDEIFTNNYALLTGTGKNFRIIGADNTVYIQNGIIFGYNPKLFKNDGTEWMLGYGLYRMVFNKSNLPGMSEFRFISTGAEILHYNKGHALNDHLNMISRIKLSVGTKIHPKLYGIYLFGGVSYNFMYAHQQLDLSHDFLKETAKKGSHFVQRWPGFHLGVMMH